VLLEALATGLPIVASDLDVFRAFVRDGEDALLVPVGDGAALGAALTRVATDRALATRLREQGLVVARRHSWARVAELHEAAYEEFLARVPAIAGRG